MVRTRVMQALFAYYKDGDKTSLTARKELLCSFQDTYDLYALLLEFVNTLTAYAEQQLQDEEQRARVTHSAYVPNRRFVENRWASQVFENRDLRRIVDEEHLSWDAGMNVVAAIWKQLQSAPYFEEYMRAEEVNYEDDKRLWRRIFSSLLTDNVQLREALEEMEVVLDHAHWGTDVDVVLSYMAKTMKRFHAEEDGADVELLPMFDDEVELRFAKDLLQYAIEGHDEYEQLINSHLKNWDSDRVAYMDRILLQTALAEVLHFPEIAVQVSLNEYIELSKEYSSDKSYIFINGVLNEILRDLVNEGRLLKPIR